MEEFYRIRRLPPAINERRRHNNITIGAGVMRLCLLSHRYHRHRRAVLNMLPGAGTGDDQGEDGGTRGSSRKSRSET